MAMKTLDKLALLKRLDPIRYEKEQGKEEEHFRQMTMAGALLPLAQIDHEHEYVLCRAVAEQLLGTVPEPEEIDTEV